LSDLRGKLAFGVQEGKDAVLHGREQIGLAADQIKLADRSYQLNDERLEKGGASASDVLLSIRGMEQAYFNHLLAISNHNKAQVRRVLLLGPAPHGPAPHGAHCAPVELQPLPPPTMLPAPPKEK